MKTFANRRAVGRAMRYARQQVGKGGFEREHGDESGRIRLSWFKFPHAVSVAFFPGDESISLDVETVDGSFENAYFGDAATVLRVLAALDLIPTELAEQHDERDERCTWCHRFGHAADQHPLPKGHPQYDAFYDASDDELAQIVSEARKPGDGR